MDFTLKKYCELLNSLKASNYKFITFEEYCRGFRYEKFVILRHDVDLLPYNSLQTANMEYSLGIRSSYYFRAIKESWDESIVRRTLRTAKKPR